MDTKEADNSIIISMSFVKNGPKINIRNLCFSQHNHHILKEINLTFPSNTISAITGPSGSGKSTFLMILNRLWDEFEKIQISGQVEINLDGKFIDIYAEPIDITWLRRKVGMVFQQPNPLPMSIFKNVAFPLMLQHIKDKQFIANEVEKVLKQVHLWDEVKDRLSADGRRLSGGQQQRLCLARTLIMNPEILLLDEPTASLDPEAVHAIENLLVELKQKCTVIMVTHYYDQIHRIADKHFKMIDKAIVENE